MGAALGALGRADPAQEQTGARGQFSPGVLFLAARALSAVVSISIPSAAAAAGAFTSWEML